MTDPFKKMGLTPERVLAGMRLECEVLTPLYLRLYGLMTENEREALGFHLRFVRDALPESARIQLQQHPLLAENDKTDKKYGPEFLLKHTQTILNYDLTDKERRVIGVVVLRFRNLVSISKNGTIAVVDVLKLLLGNRPGHAYDGGHQLLNILRDLKNGA